MSNTPQFRARAAWTAPAKRTIRDIVEAHPSLEKAKLSALYSACDLPSDADKMQAQVDLDGLVVDGSMGQKVAHPVIAESRHYRREPSALLRALGLTTRSAAAASALANKRWQDSAATGGNLTPITGVRKSARECYAAEQPEEAAASGDAPFQSLEEAKMTDYVSGAAF